MGSSSSSELEETHFELCEAEGTVGILETFMSIAPKCTFEFVDAYQRDYIFSVKYNGMDIPGRIFNGRAGIYLLNNKYQNIIYVYTDMAVHVRSFDLTLSVVHDHNWNMYGHSLVSGVDNDDYDHEKLEMICDNPISESALALIDKALDSRFVVSKADERTFKLAKRYKPLRPFVAYSDCTIVCIDDSDEIF